MWSVLTGVIIVRIALVRTAVAWSALICTAVIGMLCGIVIVITVIIVIVVIAVVPIIGIGGGSVVIVYRCR